MQYHEFESAIAKNYNNVHQEINEFEFAPEFEFLEQLFSEYESPVLSRSSRDYIKWVQQSLNKLLALSLAVDGVSGVQTKSAIRTFQSRQGLTVDGSVGPITEAALLRAGAAPIPGTTPTTPGTTPTTPGTTPWGSTLRNTIVLVAQAEFKRWGNGSIKESESFMQPVLKDYWVTGTGSDAGYRAGSAWSAAFISWVVKIAGGGNNFRYSGAHTTYTHAAKQNRLQNNANPFKAFRITEKVPQPGDIVVANRGTSTFTYDNVTAGQTGTHGDVVVSVGSTSITVVGGNVSDSVSSKPLTLDQNGFLQSSSHFAIIKVG
jgi:hypothetical protein